MSGRHPCILAGVLVAAMATPSGPLKGQEWVSVWQVGAGKAAMHRSDRTGYIASLGYTHALSGYRFIRLGGRVATGSADEGFLAASGRAVVVPLTGEFGSPYVAGEAGTLWEPEFRGAVFGIEVGLLIRAAGRFGLRGFAGWGSHDGQMGPRYIGLGIDVGG